MRQTRTSRFKMQDKNVNIQSLVLIGRTETLFLNWTNEKPLNIGK